MDEAYLRSQAKHWKAIRELCAQGERERQHEETMLNAFWCWIVAALLIITIVVHACFGIIEKRVRQHYWKRVAQHYSEEWRGR
jgi:hypothetical protein